MHYKDRDNQTFDRPVKWLVGFCVALVGFVILWVVADTFVNISYKNKVLDALSELQYVVADSSLLVGNNDVKDMLDTMIVAESTIMDSNNYLAIILTLITLCVSLSVVIPYIVGRSISAKTIKDAVEDIYTKDKQNSEIKYREYVETLLLAEGHLSRMTAYMLLSSVNKTVGLSMPQKYDGTSHPFWAIGWASKSLIRYLKCYSKNKDEYNSSFINDSVSYIVDASKIMTSPQFDLNEVKKANDKIIRAFVDIVDVLGFDKYYPEVLTNVQVKKISEGAKGLYDVIQTKKIAEGDVVKIGILKSKYREYLKPKNGIIPTQEEYKAYLEDRISKLR